MTTVQVFQRPEPRPARPPSARGVRQHQLPGPGGAHRSRAAELGLSVAVRQTDSEGQLLEWLHVAPTTPTR